MSSPHRSEVLHLYDGGWSEDESCSDGYLDEYEYLSSDDAETDTSSTSEHHCEPDFTVLEDAGDRMRDDHAGPEDNAQMCHRPCPRCPAQQLVWGSKKAGETAWTDDMHRSYLDSIEEAFVRSLYEGAACCRYGDFHCYTPGRGRWPAEDVECVCSGESTEEVESSIYEPERQIGGATTLTLPLSDHRERHGIDYDDGPTDGENTPKRLFPSKKRRCTQQTFRAGNAAERWTSGHAGGLPEEEFSGHGGSLQRILASGIEEDQVVPSVGEGGNAAAGAKSRLEVML